MKVKPQHILILILSSCGVQRGYYEDLDKGRENVKTVSYESHMDSLIKLEPTELTTFTSSCVGCSGERVHYFIADFQGEIQLSKISNRILYSSGKTEITDTRLFEIYYDSIQVEDWNAPLIKASHYLFQSFAVRSAEYNLEYIVKNYEKSDNIDSYRVKLLQLMDSTFSSIPDSHWISN